MVAPSIEDRLRRFWIFRDFSDEELAQIGQFVVEKSVALGSTLFAQGDRPDFFYLVERGTVQETGKDDSGQDILRRKAEVGDFVGRWALMHDTLRRATAVVIQNARLLAIGADDFRTMLGIFPRLERELRRIDVVNRLLSIPVFGAFSEAQLYHVADLVRQVEYPAGQTVFREGEPADALYVIDTGQLMERAADPVSGGQARPEYLSAGSFFGLQSLMTGTPRQVTATAMTELRALRLDSDSFHWLRQLQPGFDFDLVRPDVVGYLQRTGLFSRLREEDLRHLAGWVGLAHFRPGDVLYRQGEIDPTFYYLYEGEAVVRARDEEGRERPRGYLEAGHAVGEASLFLKEPRDVTVEATTKTNWIYLTWQDLDQFLAQHPELSDRVIPRDEVKERWELRRLPWMEADEQLVMRRRRHWFFLLGRLLWPALLLLAGLVVYLVPAWPRGLAYALLVPATLWIGWRLVDWLNDYYLITTARVAHREKLLLVRESRDETPLDKIQNVNIEQGLIGNALGFGTLLIDTAATVGASRVTFDYLSDPRQVQQWIFRQVSRARAGERVELRRLIRDKLEGSIGAGLRPAVPHPAVPSPAPVSPSEPPRQGIWESLMEATLGHVFWIEKRTDDQVIWRKHWIRLLARIWMPALTVLVLLMALVSYVTSVADTSGWFLLLLAGLLALALGWLWWNWENWGNDRYIVTRDRIVDIEALPLGFSTRRTETTFDRIQNVSFDIPNPIATILNYGTVMLYTAGIVGRLDFSYVRDPKGVQAEIFRRLAAYEAASRREQREEQMADLPQWFAVYEETRRS